MSFFRRDPDVVVTTVEDDDDTDDRAVAVVIYLALILGLLLLWLISVARRGDDIIIEAEPEPTESSSEITTPVPAVDPEPGVTGRLTVDGEPVFPLAEYAGPGQDLSGFSGGEAVADRVVVESVPADEGFWLGENTTDRVWVQLVRVGPESPYKVEPGDIVSFVGRVVPTSSDFPQEVGVTAAEGAEQMRDQRQHIQVEGIALDMYD